MTISLTHPLNAETKLLDLKTVEAALASLSYWSVPKVERDTETEAESAIDQMYAYF